MAGLIWSIPFDAVGLSGGTAKTVLQILTPPGQMVRLLEFSVFFDGVTAGNTPGLCELIQQNGDGTFGTTNVIPSGLVRAITLLPRTIGAINATVEPTNAKGDILKQWRVHPMNGLEKVDVLKNYLLAPATRYGIRLNFAQAVNVTGGMVAEE